MDLLSKFKVFVKGHHNTKLLSFSLSNKSIDINKIMELPIFKEDYSLSLDFQVIDAQNYKWKLFIPGIDDYHNQINNIKLNPDYGGGLTNSCRYYLPIGYHNLFDASAEYKKGKYENHPFAPNVYTVKVTDGKHWYYAHFVISAKELSIKEWSDMLDEIGRISKQLNIKHIQWEIGFTFEKKSGVTREFADELAKLVPKLRNSLHFILNCIRFETDKKYRWVHLGQEKEIDAETLRKLNEDPVDNGEIYAPYRYTNYNTPDNRWIRFITFKLLKLTIISIKYYKTLIKDISGVSESYSKVKGNQPVFEHQSEIETLTLNQHQLIELKNYLNYVLNISILSIVNHNPPMFISKGLIYSAKYNCLYRLYLHLKRVHANKLTIKPNQYRYKSTDKLYEFWIFIKIVEIIMSHNYVPVKGWGCGINSDKWLLEPNTRVLMSNPNNDIYLRLVYDDQIKRNASKYNEPIMMFGTTHNRPDIRIDVFYNQQNYWGSIILDAKYKSLTNVVREANNKGQLSDYTAKAFSKSNRDILGNNKLRCVPKVIALYPGTGNTNKNHNLRSKYAFNLSILDHLLRVKAMILRPDNLNSITNLSDNLWSLLDKRITTMEKMNPNYNKYTFYLNIDDSNATATTYDGDYITIKAGSKVVSTPKSNFPNHKLFNKLRYEGKINDNGYFTQDVSFSSPTKAGNMIYRHSISGRQSWVTKNNRTINDIFGKRK